MENFLNQLKDKLDGVPGIQPILETLQIEFNGLYILTYRNSFSLVTIELTAIDRSNLNYALEEILTDVLG